MSVAAHKHFSRSLAEKLFTRLTKTAIAFALVMGTNPYRVGLEKAAALPENYALNTSATGPVRGSASPGVVPGPKPING